MKFDKYTPRIPDPTTPRLKTSAMIASLAAEGMQTVPAPFGHALCEIAKDRPDVVGMTADLGKYTDMHIFAEKYPERFFQMGMAEQLLISAAAGMAREGFTVFATTYAVFAARRQAYMNAIGESCGLDPLPARSRAQRGRARRNRHPHHGSWICEQRPGPDHRRGPGAGGAGGTPGEALRPLLPRRSGARPRHRRGGPRAGHREELRGCVRRVG